MATDPSLQHTTSGGFSGLGGHAHRATVLGPDAAGWLRARAADGAEVTVSVEVDERHWRLRRTVGGTASMFERAMTVPTTATEVAGAVLRWASTAGIPARVQSDPRGVSRVVLGRPRDGAGTAV